MYIIKVSTYFLFMSSFLGNDDSIQKEIVFYPINRDLAGSDGFKINREFMQSKRSEFNVLDLRVRRTFGPQIICEFLL